MAKSPKNEDYGTPVPFDPTFHGPLRNRSCTDIICLLLFLAFIGCWAGLGLYAILNGDPNILLIPKDSQGARCGLDSHVQHKPYLFFFDLTKCISPQVLISGCPTPQVCVEKCPTENFMAPDDISSSLENVICMYDILPTNRDNAIDLINAGMCASWYLESSSVQKRCLPTTSALKQLNSTFSDTIKDAVENIKLLGKAEQVGLNIVDDLMQSWWHILLFMGFGLLVCIIYIAIQRWIGGVMVWISIFGVIALLIFCVYFSTTKYIYFRDNASTNEGSVIERYLGNKNVWLAALIVSSVFLGIILLVLLVLTSRIKIAIELIKESSKAVSAANSALFFPIVPWVLQLGIIAYTIAVALYLATIGESLYKVKNFSSDNCICSGEAAGYTNDSFCDPLIFRSNCVSASTFSTTHSMCSEASCSFVGMDNPQYSSYLHAINIFGFFWTAFFVSGFGQMVLASVFATWYWTWKKSDLPFFAVTDAACRTLRYHIGTIAFGSLILAICRIIRVILEYIDHKLKKYDNPITRALLCCLKCFFWCLEKFIKFINKNAYIMCAIHGKNFCTSAKDAFGLLMRNILRVFVLDKVTDFLFFLSKILLSAGMGCMAYAIFVMNVGDLYQTKLNYDLVPVIVIIITTYLIATVFFSVYSMAVDTLFLCFLEDSERNDGSPEKPYFMTKNLMKILGKKNKLH